MNEPRLVPTVREIQMPQAICIALCLAMCPATGSHANQAPESSVSTSTGQPTSGATSAGQPVSSPRTEPTSEQKEQRRLSWERMLAQIAAREKCALLVDTNDCEKMIAPRMDYERPASERAMRMLARAFRLDWKPVEGVQTFAKADRATQDIVADSAAAYRLLAELPEQDLRRTLAGTVQMTGLAPEARDLFERLAGVDPAMNATLLDKEDEMCLRLSVHPVLHYTDPAAGAARSIELHFAGPEKWNTITSAGGKPVVPSRLDIPKKGLLDFGEGKILTLRELLRIAGAQFHVKYGADPRIIQTYYFVNGCMNERALEAALARVTTVFPAKMIVSKHDDIPGNRAMLTARLAALLTGTKVDITSMRYRLGLKLSPEQRKQVDEAYGATETLDAGGVFSGDPITVRRLVGGRPGLAYIMKEIGVSPDTFVTLSTSLVLEIGCSGSRLLAQETNDSHNAAYSDNTTRIRLP